MVTRHESAGQQYGLVTRLGVCTVIVHYTYRQNVASVTVESWTDYREYEVACK